MCVLPFCPQKTDSLNIFFSIPSNSLLYNNVNTLQISLLLLYPCQASLVRSRSRVLQIWIALFLFPKVPKQPGCPLTSEPRFTGKAGGEAAICIPHGASRPRRCRDGERTERHTSLPLTNGRKEIN